MPATDTSVWSDDVWSVDSTPVECGRSRETVKRSALTGWAEYGYCVSHSRYFWGLRLHLVCTLQGLPVAFALTGAKADERESPLDLLAAEPDLVADWPGQTLIGDRNYFDRDFEQQLAEQDMHCCGQPAMASRNGQAHRCSNRCGRSSSRSTKPSSGCELRVRARLEDVIREGELEGGGCRVLPRA
nr:transposase [Streptomyces montanus]